MASSSSVETDVRPRVLIINDESDLLEALALVLEDTGCKVELVCGGVNVEQDVARVRPDLILLDWVMPEATGDEVLRRLRKLGEARTRSPV